MLKRLVTRLPLRRTLTREDLAAREEAKRLQEDMLSVRTYDRTGPQGSLSDTGTGRKGF